MRLVSRFCQDNDSGVTYPLTAWNTGGHVNIYDGPAYQDANAFLDIYPSKCATQEECMYYGGTLGVRAAQTVFSTVPDGAVTVGQGFLPNAAIGWKQSNGFYYPPAFHSRNLFFKDVGIRHYVVEPLTFPEHIAQTPNSRGSNMPASEVIRACSGTSATWIGRLSSTMTTVRLLD